jgi:hypothetical protein
VWQTTFHCKTIGILQNVTRRTSEFQGFYSTLAQERVQWRVLVNTVMKLRIS